MQAMEKLYDITERTIKDRTKMLGSTIDEVAADTRDKALTQQRRDQSVLKTQLSDLAAALCLNMEDKIRLHSQ
jgi:nuclear pore complex protein Nup133